MKCGLETARLLFWWETRMLLLNTKDPTAFHVILLIITGEAIMNMIMFGKSAGRGMKDMPRLSPKP